MPRRSLTRSTTVGIVSPLTNLLQSFLKVPLSKFYMVNAMAEKPWLFPRVRSRAYLTATRERVKIAEENIDRVKVALRDPEAIILAGPLSLAQAEFALPRKRAIKKNRYQLISKGPLGERFVRGKPRKIRGR